MRKFFKYFGIIVLLAIIIAAFFYFRFSPAKTPIWGLTFSYQEAKGLGFDDRQMYLDILSDLKPKNIRLMTYWEDLEKQPGQFDFANVDWQLEQAEKYKAQVILVVGRKQPRWPECHQPTWFGTLSVSDQNQAVLDFVKATVEHFKSSPVIKSWEVENEPYFGFGPNCPKSEGNLLKHEISLVKNLDARPVLVTDSGDRGSWLASVNAGADNFGFTLYRVSYDEKYGGYYKYPLPPAFYRVRAGILETFTHVKQIVDIELQMEPWFTNGALNTSVDKQKTLMNASVFAENIKYAKKTGVSEHYLWGVEWWYWMAKKQNDWGMWAAAKDLLVDN